MTLLVSSSLCPRATLCACDLSERGSHSSHGSRASSRYSRLHFSSRPVFFFFCGSVLSFSVSCFCFLCVPRFSGVHAALERLGRRYAGACTFPRSFHFCARARLCIHPRHAFTLCRKQCVSCASVFFFICILLRLFLGARFVLYFCRLLPSLFKRIASVWVFIAVGSSSCTGANMMNTHPAHKTQLPFSYLATSRGMCVVASTNSFQQDDSSPNSLFLFLGSAAFHALAIGSFSLCNPPFFCITGCL